MGACGSKRAAGHDGGTDQGAGGAAPADDGGGDGGASGASGAGGCAGAADLDAGAAGRRGTGGAFADGGGSDNPGALAACPEPAPSTGDACPGQSFTTCLYATTSCACYPDGWRCIDCPANQPQPTDHCDTIPATASLTCRYASFTCSCNRNDSMGAWHCGVCPQSHPTAGEACGNSTFECRYDSDICQCDVTGKWKCGTVTCPPDAVYGLGRPSGCAAPGFYTCRYPAEDENCVCGPVGLSYPCSCPTAQPADGSHCIASTGDCTYGDTICTCAGSWRCGPRTCPADKPSTGASCTAQLSCTYAGSFCACNGTSWTCS